MSELRLRARRRRRLAISEVLGSLIMVSITLIAGAAVFGFINGQASNSAQAVGNSAAQGANYLNEKETIVYACPSVSGACSSIGSPVSTAIVYVYNSGAINPETMVSLTAKDNTVGGSCVTTGISVSISERTTQAITVTCSNSFFVAGHSYTFEVFGKYTSSASLSVGF